jgi:hypothetical protein
MRIADMGGTSPPTRVRSGLFAVLASVLTVATALGVTGCASWWSPKDKARDEKRDVACEGVPDSMQDGMRSDARAPIYPCHVPNLPNCACTLEHRTNLCVTVNGSESLPDSLSFLREREDGARDSLAYHPRCFGEWRGVQRVLMLREGALVDSTGWFEIQTVDCCHGEAKTVDFKKQEAR